MTIAWLIGLAAAVPAATPAATGAAARSAAKWVVDWGEQRCSLIRQTGGEASPTLMVRTVPGAGQAELWLLDPNWTGPHFVGFQRVELGLQPSGFRAADYAISVRFKGQQGIGITNLEEGFLDELPGTTRLIVRRGKRTLAEVPLPGSARAVDALRACEAEILRDWGLDPKVIQSLQRRPTPVRRPALWFNSTDYPRAAVQMRQTGSVLTRMTVGTDGRVSECVIVESSGHALLDRRTCELLVNRGRYKPALTAAGEPIRAMTSVRIHWRLP